MLKLKGIYLFLFISVNLIYGFNSNIIIEGRVTDSETNSPLPSANVLLIDTKDNSTVGFSSTDNNGKFTLTPKKQGSYFLSVSFLGYEKYLSDTLHITDKSLNMEEIKLSRQSVSIEEVEVTAKKDPVLFKIDRLTVNVDVLKTSPTETVTELLRKVPTVWVTDGNISINGTGSATILIDGKKSLLTSFDQLETTTLDNIDHIDVMANPSAKYSAEGTGGIINIITKKKDTKLLFKGKISTEAGTHDYYKTSEYLYFGINDLGIRLNHYYNKRTSKSESYFYQTGNSYNIRNYSNQNEYNYKRDYNRFSVVADYTFSENTSVVTSINFSPQVNTVQREGIAIIEMPQNLNSVNDYNSTTNNNGKYFEYSVNFTTKPDSSNSTITADFQYSLSDNVNDQNMNQRYSVNGFKPFYYYYNTSHREVDNKVFYAKINYSKEINDSTSFETGVNTNLRNYESIQSIESVGNFNFEDQIHAAYLSFTSKIGEIGYSFGLRGEYTNLESYNQLQGFNLSRNYFDLFPTAYLLYKFSENNSLNLSYSRRINRPWLSFYNMYENQITPNEIVKGNPEIKPSYSHSIDLTNNVKLFGSYFNFGLNYRVIKDVYNTPQETNEQGMTIIMPINNENVEAFGVNANTTISMFKFWTLTLGGNYTRYDVETQKLNGRIYQYINDSYYYNVMSQFSLPFELKLFAQLMVASGLNNSETDKSDLIYSDLSLSRSFFKRKLNFTLKYSNPIDHRSITHYNSIEYSTYSVSSNPYNIISLSVSYNFNKYRSKRVRTTDLDSGELK